MPRFLSVTQHASTPRAIHAVLTGPASKRLTVSALPGVRPDGVMPDGREPQAEQAFDNLAVLLGHAGLRREDLVAVRVYVVGDGAGALVERLMAAKLAGVRLPAAVREVIALSQPGILIELDAEALGE